MKLLVTGRNGQVATALRELDAPGVTVAALGRPDLDLEDPVRAAAAIRRAEADVVVNAAACTAVDRAESEPELAHRINALSAGAMAAAAAERGLPFIQLSTDYVFDGAKAEAYVETDAVGPTGVYGATKLEGERLAAAANPDHAILRTAWVYAPHGRNFMRTMLRLAETRDEIAVVADQIGNPTSAADIAGAVVAVARNMLRAPLDPALRGVFHMSAEGEASWADFAEFILAASAGRGGPAASVRRIPTSEYPTAARRPANSRLDCGRLAARHGVRLPPWRDSAIACLNQLLRDRAAAQTGTRS
jgi:dTDP-4-dehydrorhamnose reductase